MKPVRRAKKLLSYLLLILFSAVLLPQPAAQAALVGTSAALAAETGDAARSQIDVMLSRSDLRAQLEASGVDVATLDQRVAQLSDEEAVAMAEQFEQLPAGQGVLEVAVFIFVVLLITDIAGYTDIFPFVNKRK